MNTKRKALLLNTFFSVLCFAILITMESCMEEEYIPDEADLIVHVTGTFSGKDRSNIKVTLYFSKEDANGSINGLNMSLVTDENGNVHFYNLEVGIRYWVRADTLLLFSTRQTRELKSGSNQIEIRVI